MSSQVLTVLQTDLPLHFSPRNPFVKHSPVQHTIYLPCCSIQEIIQQQAGQKATTRKQVSRYPVWIYNNFMLCLGVKDNAVSLNHIPIHQIGCPGTRCKSLLIQNPHGSTCLLSTLMPPGGLFPLSPLLGARFCECKPPLITTVIFVPQRLPSTKCRGGKLGSERPRE